MAEGISSLSDAALLALAENLHAVVVVEPTDYGTTVAKVAALQGATSNFDSAYAGHVDKQNQAKAQTIFKTEQRAILEAEIRDMRVGAKAAKIPESAYAQMGIPTASSPAPTNATVPAVQVNTSERLRHTLSWTDAASLDNKKKPRGVVGAEIWVKIDGPPPGNEADCTFLALDTATPYMKEYSPAEAGKTAHYMLRWAIRDGSVSAWGETVSATITG